MADQGSRGDIQLNRNLLVGGGVLVALGGLLGFAGMALVGSALKAAASAGAAAWRDNPPKG